MKAFLRTFAVALLVPTFAMGAALDIRMSQRNSSNTAWMDVIFAKQNSSLIGTSSTGIPSIVTIGSGLDLTSGVLTAPGGGGGAPTTATYITQTPNGSLGNEQALSLLSSGIMRVATTTGAITSLGDPTTIGSSFMFTANPSAITFVRVNADNTVSYLSAADHKTALGLVAVATSGSASDLSAGTLPAARMPALTGDITTSSGAVVTTLATVNSNVGTFGNATQSPSITVDAKGRITAISNTTITAAPLNPTQNDLAGGTVLTVGSEYFDDFAANRTLTFTGTAEEGSHILLTANVTVPVITLTVPSSKALGDSTTSTAVVLTAGTQVVRFDRTDGEWIRTASGGVINNYSATTAPGTTDDAADGFSIGSIWVNTTTDYIYACVDATASAAVWVQLDNQVLNGDNITSGTVAAARIDAALVRTTAIDTNAELRAITVGLGAAVVGGSFASPTVTDPLTLTANDCYGFVRFYGATGVINLPAGVVGMNGVIYNTGAFTITIDPNGSEIVVRDGTAQTGGVSFTLSSGAGNFVAIVFDGTRWVTLGYKGTLAEGS